MDEFRGLMASALANCPLLRGMGEKEVAGLIELPPDEALGDLAFPCFRLASRLRRAPNEIALEIMNQLKLPPEFREARIAGAYINFFFDEGKLAKRVVEKILKEKKAFGRNDSGKGRRVMVEYSSPNTNKPLHVGHLRNDSIGMAVAGLLANCGFRVIKVELVNDRGAHICKSMLAYSKWGRGRTPASEKMKGDHFVGKYYTLYAQKEAEHPELEDEVRQMLLDWEAGDKKVRALWKKMNNWAWAGFMQSYKEFGSCFDVFFRESEFYDKARPIIRDGLMKGVFVRDESGAIIADLEKHGLPKKTVLRADGTSIYLTNDLALTRYRFQKYHLDRCIWVVGSEHNYYFRQLFKIFELLGYEWVSKCVYLGHGMVFLPEGRLKSREGRVIDADELIDNAEQLALKELKERHELSGKEMKKRAHAIALAAIKFYMLKNEAAKDMLFEMDKAVSFEGETGPYLQYSYARAKSILRRAKTKWGRADYSALTEWEEKGLIKLLLAYPESALDAAEKLNPSRLCQHLFETASAFNLFYHSQPVLQAGEKLRQARLGLVEATAIVLKNGLALLNIGTLEEM